MVCINILERTIEELLLNTNKRTPYNVKEIDISSYKTLPNVPKLDLFIVKHLLK